MNPYFELKYAGLLMRDGFSPFWNPYLSCGTPLWAQPGLALGYPGTLLALLLPSPFDQILFLALHGILAFCGARRFAERIGLRLPSAFGAAAYTLAALLLGFRLGPSYIAGLAWLPWLFLWDNVLDGLALSALLFSTFDLISISLAFFGAYAVPKESRRRYLAVLGGAALCAAPILLPSTQAFFLTQLKGGGLFRLSSDEGLDLAKEMRGMRLIPASDTVLNSRVPLSRVLWANGSRRPLWSFSFLENALPREGEARSIGLDLWGVGASLSRDQEALQSLRLNAPMRAAVVNSARLKDQSADILSLEGRPFYTRPLLLDEAGGNNDPQAEGGVWTLLSPNVDGLGQTSLVLPPKIEKGSWLYLSDNAYPGWEANVDGFMRPIYRAEGSFRAVALQAGDRTIQFLYRPLLFYFGLCLCGLAFFLIFWRRQELESLR